MVPVSLRLSSVQAGSFSGFLFATTSVKSTYITAVIVHFIQTILRIIFVNLAPGFYMEIFYRLSSLFALESFLSSQCTIGNTVLREVLVFLGIFFFIRIERLIAKMEKRNSSFATFSCYAVYVVNFISRFKNPGLANEAD